MGLLEEEIREIRQAMRDFDSGVVDADQIRTKIGLWSQTEKRTRLILDAYAIRNKYGKSDFKRISNTGLLGDGSAIDMGIDLENDKVKCPDKDFGLVSRQECLDYSGMAEHNDYCSKCYNFGVTRRMLCNG